VFEPTSNTPIRILETVLADWVQCTEALPSALGFIRG
jgi:hypothetical protein